MLVNGRPAGEHFDIFLPFELDITDAVNWNGENELLVGVREPGLFEEEFTTGTRTWPYGSFWGKHIVGIWQDVYLLARPALHITDAYIKPLLDQDCLEVDITVRNTGTAAVDLHVAGSVHAWISLAGNDMLEAPVPKWHLDDDAGMTMPEQTLAIPANGEACISLRQTVAGKLKTWTPDAPNLYGLVLKLRQDSETVDCHYQRFGWRQFSFDGSQQLLNGEPIEVRSDSWHFLGIPQLTRRYAWSWYTMIKQANGNAVRPHAQVYPRFYLDMADEMGVMVLAETAIWASDGAMKFDSDKTWTRCDEHIQNMVRRDRNHPSIFGWSVANEVLPVMINVRHMPKESVQQMCRRYAHWAALVRELDATRPWISADGDGDAEGHLPTIVGHYAPPETMREWAESGKPWGIGEQTMAYYASPRQAAAFNGERAYESLHGRMEAIALEAYEQIVRQQRANHAAYCSVFNLAWYGQEPLALGQPDTRRRYTLEDGIFFPDFVEGKPGVQPERLGPYTTTFNPGYDPGLPLYRPWPMFAAVKAAFATPPAACRWDTMPELPETTEPPLPQGEIKQAAFIGDRRGALATQLHLLGANLTEPGNDPAMLLIIDGSAAPPDPAAAKLQVDTTLAAGGKVVLMTPQPEALPALNQLLPAALELEARNCASLLPVTEHPLIAELHPSNLYFCELDPSTIMEYGMTGPLVEQGQVLLKACNTDWRQWNRQMENVKTAMVLRSEREAKGAEAALLRLPVDEGTLVVSTINGFTEATERVKFGRRLLANLGLHLEETRSLIEGGLFDNRGVLQQVQATCPPPPSADPNAPLQPCPADSTWQPMQTTTHELFDLRELKPAAAGSTAAAYVRLWLHSPRALDDLLIEPDVPKLDLHLASDHGVVVWLNDKLILDNQTEGVAHRGHRHQCPGLPLTDGWNKLLIKIPGGNGDWRIGAKLTCTHDSFLTELRSALEKPAM